MTVPQPSAAAPLAECEEGSLPLSARGWRATVVGVHVVMAAVWLLAAGTVLVDGDVDNGRRAVALGVLAVLALAYCLAGAHAIGGDRPRSGAVYLTVLVGSIGALGFVAPGLLFLMFLAYPQVWFLVPTTVSGIAWTVALALAGALGPVVTATTGQTPASALLSAGVGMVFSLSLGVWVSRVIDQSMQRADLIEQLERTRAELAVAHHERGVLAERERLAREVHDTLAQGYTSIVVLAQTAVAALPNSAAVAAERLGVIEEVARENLAEARAMVAAFSPMALESATLVEALQRLAERFRRETGIVTRLDTDALGVAAPGLNRTEEIVLLRGAQEALANVRRHAAASAVVLRVSRVGAGEAGQVSMHVEDDGIGFDPASSAGVGLAGLRSRAEEVGGSVDVASAPGHGTRVTVRVPVP
jgi:signal transduction histidine kinase